MAWDTLGIVDRRAPRVQVGLYLADWYDDGVAEPLSLGIGIVILVAAGVLSALPFVRSPSR